MKTKGMSLLILFIALISIASVSAANLTENNDFDGLFSMKVASDDNFSQVEYSSSYSSFLKAGAAYKNSNDTIFVLYYGDFGINQCIEMMSDNTVKWEDVVKDGDLTLFNATSQMNVYMGNYTISTFAGLTSDTGNHDSTVIIGGTNETLVKEYAETIEFKE